VNATPAQAKQPHPPIVLLVEDDESNREMYSLALESAGYWVLGARNGDEGLQTAKEYKPDVIVTDLGLPGMDGWAFARALRASPSTAEAGIIAVSGRARDEMAAENVEHAEVDVLLTKPCLPEDLLREIRKVLARGRMARIKGADQLARAKMLREKSDHLIEKSRRLQGKSRG
jgi:CheY-like chemotaxis protein